MRLLLLIAVLALGADALLYSGAYTQRAWQAVSHEASRLVAGADVAVDNLDRKADRRG
jgi:hypothetical protein